MAKGTVFGFYGVFAGMAAIQDLFRFGMGKGEILGRSLMIFLCFE